MHATKKYCTRPKNSVKDRLTQGQKHSDVDHNQSHVDWVLLARRVSHDQRNLTSLAVAGHPRPEVRSPGRLYILDLFRISLHNIACTP